MSRVDFLPTYGFKSLRHCHLTS